MDHFGQAAGALIHRWALAFPACWASPPGLPWAATAASRARLGFPLALGGVYFA